MNAGGNGSGGEGGKKGRIRGDADTTEIETVGVEADGKGGVGLGWSAVVDFAGGDEEGHAGVIELEMTSVAKFESELCSARAVLRVPIFIFPAGVVKQGEEPNNLLISRMEAGEVEAVAADRAPVEWTVF